MPQFTLPSGGVIETRDPTWGEVLHVTSEGVDNLEELIYTKQLILFPGLTREIIAALSPKDGRALLKEMKRLWEGEDGEEDGLKDGSEPPSEANQPAPTQ